MLRHLLALALALLAGSTGLAQQDTRPEKYRPMGTPLELGLAGFAKVVCSAVFVSGRDPAEAARNNGHLLMPSEEESMTATWSIDREQKIVRMTLGGITREAKFYGDQGCIIHRPERQEKQIFFSPTAVKSALPEAMSQPWPMGDRPDTSAWPAGVDKAKVDAAVQAAFSDPAALTASWMLPDL